MKSYTFPIEIEPDEDRWFARVPDLESQGAATWGQTRDDVIRNIQEVAHMVIESILEDGKSADWPAGGSTAGATSPSAYESR